VLPPQSSGPELNAYAILVVVALVGGWLVNRVADALNLRSLAPELPEEFCDTYDAERYRRSQAYTREKTRFGFWPATVELAALLAFWFAGWFEWLDEHVRALGWGAIPSGLAYVGALFVAQGALSLPFSVYATFVIEERWGFNKTTPRTFVLDVLKGLLLAAAIGGPICALVLWFFEGFGERAWWLAWGAVAFVSVTLQFVAPTWILPLFNKFTPLEEGELRAAILAYAERVGFPLKGLFVIDGSRRSSKANAFFTGFGRKKRIALFDTLIAQHTRDELVAIVAHEVGHYKKGHVLQGMAIGVAQLGAIFFLLSLCLGEPGMFAAFGVTRPSIYVGLVLFALLWSPIDLVLSFGMQAWSRRNEFAADRFARETTGAGEVLAVALKKLSAETLSNLTPHRLYVLLHHSHPPVLERVRALRAAG
jgi:STE24 endopeptidase